MAVLDNLPVGFDLLLARVPVGSHASNFLHERSLDAGVSACGDFEGRVLIVDAGEGSLGPLAIVDRPSVSFTAGVANHRFVESLLRRKCHVAHECFLGGGNLSVPLSPRLVDSCCLAFGDDTAGLSVASQWLSTLFGRVGHVGHRIDTVTPLEKRVFDGGGTVCLLSLGPL